MGLLSWLFGSDPTADSTDVADEPAVAREHVVWSASDSPNSGEVVWTKSDEVFPSEDLAFEAAKHQEGDAVREVRVLKADRPAPRADSPILAGRVAEAPRVPGIQKAQKFTFHNDGTMTFESGNTVETYRYTIDEEELWIVWGFSAQTWDQVYKFTEDGFQLARTKERPTGAWEEYPDPEPNNIYKYTN